MTNKDRVCSIPDCANPYRSKGWCEKHYRRWRKHGGPLAGGTSPRGEARRFFEEIVLAYEGDECLPWPYAKDAAGYGKIRFDGRLHTVSRLVCERVNGPPPTPEHEAAHSCGKGHEACCTKRHLSWKTHLANIADTIAHGTRARGDRQGSSKLTEVDVIQIRALAGTMPQRKLAERFGINQVQVSRIHRRTTWAWLD